MKVTWSPPPPIVAAEARASSVIKTPWSFPALSHVPGEAMFCELIFLGSEHVVPACFLFSQPRVLSLLISPPLMGAYREVGPGREDGVSWEGDRQEAASGSKIRCVWAEKSRE